MANPLPDKLGSLPGVAANVWAEVQKVRQPGNLVARKFLKNQALAESFWTLPSHFLMIKQVGGNGKEILLVCLQNGHILQFSSIKFLSAWSFITISLKTS